MNEQGSNSSEYLDKEIDYLRNTYLALRKETRDLESYTLLAIGVIWSWFATNSNATHAVFIVWLPLILVQLFGIRALGVFMQMRTIRKYLKQIENDKLPSGSGWENFLEQDKARFIWPITAFSFWTALTILAIIVPFLIRAI